MHRVITPTVDPAGSRNERKKWQACVAQNLPFRMSSFRITVWTKENKKIALHCISFNNATMKLEDKACKKYFLISILYEEHGSELANWGDESLDITPQGLKDTRVHPNMYPFLLLFPPFSSHCFLNKSAWGLVKECPWLYIG